jgi:kynurenine formamidase
VDAISVDPLSSETFDVHKILLKKDMVMLENLKGLERLNGIFELTCLPLNIKEADGSPIRAIARTEK